MKLILLLVPLVFSTEISPRSSRTIGSFFGYSSAPKTVTEQQQQQQQQQQEYQQQRPLVYQVKYYDGRNNGIDKVGVAGTTQQQHQQHQQTGDGQYQVVPPYYYYTQPYVVPCPVEYYYVSGVNVGDRQKQTQQQVQQQTVVPAVQQVQQVQPGVVQPVIPVPMVQQQDKPTTYNSKQQQRPVGQYQHQVPFPGVVGQQVPFSVGQQFGGVGVGQPNVVPYSYSNAGQPVPHQAGGQQVPYPAGVGVGHQVFQQQQAPFYYPDYPYYPYYYNPVVAAEVPAVPQVPYAAYFYKSYVNRDPVVTSASATTQQQQRVDKDGTTVTDKKQEQQQQQQQ